LGELGGLARNLPNPHLLISPFLRREAVLSSRIEGTQASLSDLFFFEAADSARFMPDRQTPHDVREVANYVKALEYALKRLDELPLSLRLIRELHEILLSGVRGQHWTPGEFRSSQNWIGPPGSTLMEAVYVPPPPQEMVEALGEFEKYLHAPSGLPPLIRIALVHYQFEAIHPFLDGNGRIGRLLISLLLCSEGLVPQPLLYISAFFERQRADYYRHLLHVSLAGQWTAWLIFFLEGVAQQSRDAIWRTAQLLSMWQSYRSRLQEARSSALLLQLVDRLFQYPVLSVPGTTKALEITHRSATKLIERLVAARILTEVTGRERNRLYVAQDIIKAMEAEVPKEDEPLAARRSDEGDVQ
jgi:Fic family protein